MASAYRMQIVNLNGTVVWSTVPGMAAEVELMNNLLGRVAAKGVGMTRTQAHVLSDVKAAFGELLSDLKVIVPPPQHGDVA